MADIKNIVEEIKKLSLVEVSELVKALEEEFGVSAAAAVAAPVAGGAAAPAADGHACSHSRARYMFLSIACDGRCVRCHRGAVVSFHPYTNLSYI